MPSVILASAVKMHTQGHGPYTLYGNSLIILI